MTTLPVESYLPQILSELKKSGALVLSAAPGTGKTTLIPPALLEQFSGSIYLLEPRRIAVRSAAKRIASQLGESVGNKVGFIVRGEQKISSNSRLVVMTPGIFLRKIQKDPMLEGVDVIIFDEFHERSLENDLDFTFALEVRKELRPDLKIVILSATLSTSEIALKLNATVFKVPGREFPVEIIWSENPIAMENSSRLVAKAVIEAWKNYSGDILAFLPGAGEISDCAAMLSVSLPGEALICQLHGALESKAQDNALSPTPLGKRKIVLSTNIAESSLTIEGIKIVVDSGLVRRLRYIPNRGMSSLEIERISQASAQQRAGRAGRTGPGVVIRLWNAASHQQLQKFTPPEIIEAELSSFALEVTAWGATPQVLDWLTSPPEAAYNNGVELLKKLGLLDENGKLTSLGIHGVQMPIHPRLSAMLLRSKEYNLSPLGAEIAALLEEKDDFFNFSSVDICQRIEHMRHNPAKYRLQLHIRDQILRNLSCPYQELSTDFAGIIIAFAYPEWIGKARIRHGENYHLANGMGAQLPKHDMLSKEEFIAVARLAGKSGRNSSIIRLAAQITLSELKEYFSQLFHRRTSYEFDSDSGKATAWSELCLMELVISKTPVPPPPAAMGLAILNEALRRNISLPPVEDQGACRLINRLRFACNNNPEKFPNWSLNLWSKTLVEILTPYLDEVKDFSSLRKLPFLSIFTNAIGFPLMAELDRLYPDFFVAPTGSKHKVDYSGEIPTLSIRVQELYGLHVHPTVGKNKLPLRIELLSPARRPVQITSDLPGFWAGSWKLVRSEMRSRYPKHSWPENP